MKKSLKSILACLLALVLVVPALSGALAEDMVQVKGTLESKYALCFAAFPADANPNPESQMYLCYSTHYTLILFHKRHTLYSFYR